MPYDNWKMNEKEGEDDRWMQKATKRPGAFKAKAKRAGKTVLQYARQVLKKGSRASKRTKQQANLAQTYAKYRPKKKKE